jgi:heme O synthase-like polyprenyltransferase
MRGYLDLMKLRVVELLLVSTLPAMVLAAKGLPEFGLAFATIVAGTLAAGSANAFNMVIESDLDKLMARTAKRPIVTGQISRKTATVFATLIGLLALIIFWIFTTPLATLLALIAIVFYVVVYTMALKQRTSQNIVIASSIWLIVAAELPVWSLVVTITLGLVFAVQLVALKEGSEEYAKVAGKIFQWSITYLSLLSVLLVVAQLLS